jgi:hypothetical protein
MPVDCLPDLRTILPFFNAVIFDDAGTILISSHRPKQEQDRFVRAGFEYFPMRNQRLDFANRKTTDEHPRELAV